MTSLAVIPPLKRTITDIMDEELYHLPSSPLNVQSTSNNAGAAGVNRSDSPKPASLFHVEEDFSDDDDDEDDFFNDDNEFDDFIMNSQYEYLPQDDQQYQTQQPPQQPPQQEPEIKPWDMYIKDNLMNGGFIDDFGVNKEEVVDGNPKEILSPPPLTNLNINDHKHEEEDDDDQMMVDDTPMKTAAEISANNPNHQCDKINPSTGKPCNKQFSRPYDLIRHQETIHALKKKIFRCVICEGRLNGGDGNGKQKTFSRGDALSRHIKVKHGLGVGKYYG
ncbi:hypothetical protein QCA50_012696 [Cerrena zonata]|uniref:C2H2-type domain-containing protein n=1 Tax=Cerrena zonata TaxID=2478898 RepID=A0AAW0G0Z0_9APHY